MISWDQVVFIGQAPRRRGRPLAGDKPMTSTERAKRSRKKAKERLAEAKAELKALKAQLKMEESDG